MPDIKSTQGPRQDPKLYPDQPGGKVQLAPNDIRNLPFDRPTQKLFYAYAKGKKRQKEFEDFVAEQAKNIGKLFGVNKTVEKYIINKFEEVIKELNENDKLFNMVVGPYVMQYQKGVEKFHTIGKGDIENAMQAWLVQQGQSQTDIVGIMKAIQAIAREAKTAEKGSEKHWTKTQINVVVNKNVEEWTEDDWDVAGEVTADIANKMKTQNESYNAMIREGIFGDVIAKASKWLMKKLDSYVKNLRKSNDMLRDIQAMQSKSQVESKVYEYMRQNHNVTPILK
jgi:hypothetical protein